LTREHVCEKALSLEGGRVKSWSDEDVKAWLKRVKCPEVAIKAFKKEDVDGATLLEITDNDLKDMGMTKIQDRKHLLRCLKKLAYYELYPSCCAGDNDSGFMENNSKMERKFDLPASAFHRTQGRRGLFVVGSLTVVWEVVMNLMMFHPMLHLISLFPLTLTLFGAVSWWYSV